MRQFALIWLVRTLHSQLVHDDLSRQLIKRVIRTAQLALPLLPLVGDRGRATARWTCRLSYLYLLEGGLWRFANDDRACCWDDFLRGFSHFVAAGADRIDSSHLSLGIVAQGALILPARGGLHRHVVAQQSRLSLVDRVNVVAESVLTNLCKGTGRFGLLR